MTPELNAPIMEMLIMPMRTLANHSGFELASNIKPPKRLAKKRIMQQLQTMPALRQILAYRSAFVGVIVMMLDVA
jgi:hypothetical protein